VIEASCHDLFLQNPSNSNPEEGAVIRYYGEIHAIFLAAAAGVVTGNTGSASQLQIGDQAQQN